MNESERIGNSEREAAVSALKQHLSAGRLTSTEYEERSVQARDARTRGELTPLFTDLPGEFSLDAPAADHSGTSRSTTATNQPPIGQPVVSQPHQSRHGNGIIPEPYASTITALAPIIAVVLFFVTNSWLWFLAIPAVGILIYGPGNHKHKN